MVDGGYIKYLEKTILKEKKIDFYSLRNPRLPITVHTKFQSIRFSRLAGFR